MKIDLTGLDITTPLFKPNGNTAWTLSGKEALALAGSCVYETKNGIVFDARTFGAATSSVHRTRCEWKESTPWKLQSKKVHINSQTFILHQINNALSVVISQTHDDNSNSPLAKIFCQKKNGFLSILAGVRTKKVSSDPAKELVLFNFELGKEATIKQTLDSQEMTLTLEVIQGSNIGKKVWNLDPAWNTTELVFHGGVYNQIDMPSVNDWSGSKMELFSLGISHYDVEAIPEVPSLDEYQVLQSRLDTIEADYLKALKVVQSDVKTKLNTLSTDMKSSTDKAKLAPIYAEISSLKTKLSEALSIGL